MIDSVCTILSVNKTHGHFYNTETTTCAIECPRHACQQEAVHLLHITSIQVFPACTDETHTNFTGFAVG